MSRLRTIAVSAVFAAAAAIMYGAANKAYVDGYNRNEAESAAAQKEIAALLPHVINLRTGFETATDDSRFLWRNANRAIEDAQRVMNTPVRADAERDCDILFRLNEINIATGNQHRLSAESLQTFNMCRKHLVRFRGL